MCYTLWMVDSRMMQKRILHPFVILTVCISLVLLIPGSGPAHAEDSPLVLAFYYAWYDQNTWDSGLSADRPLQPYVSSDPGTIERHVSQAQAAGLDALIQSWYGPHEAGNQTETNFQTLLDVAAVRGFHAAVDFETTGPFFTDQASVVDALRHLLAVHAQHPAYLRYQGKPVVFFWRQQRFGIDEWADIRAQVDPDHDSLWIAEGVDISYQSVFDGHHLYSVAWSPDVEHTLTDWGFRVRRFESQNGADRLWVATVMPGYDDTRTDRADTFAVDRQDGSYYRATWSAAAASQPDWVIITSFNEWIEGTMIEPSVNYGDFYLDLTRQLATEFKSGNQELVTEVQEEQSSTKKPSGESQEAGNIVQIEPYIRAEEAVRVRSGPGTEYERVGQLWPGETAPVMGQNADGLWWQIEFAGTDDGLGWVIADFVTFVGDPDSVPIVGEEPLTPTLALSPTATVAVTTTVAATTPTTTRTPSPTHTSVSTQTPVPTRTSVSTQTPVPTSTPQPTQPTLTPTPSATPTQTPVPTITPLPTPTFTLTPVISPTATPTATSTPVVRVNPVAHRRPVGFLWLGGGALVVAGGLGILLLRATRVNRKR
jgi:uncharacterized protein YraI